MQMKFSDNIKTANQLLDTGKYTLVLVRAGEIKTSSERGIKPLMNLYLDSGSYAEFSAADRVIGKAAAFMYVLLGISEVYAEVISERALEVFERYSINIDYGKCVPAIENRTKTGFCPMESAVWDIDEPKDALAAIRNKLNELQKPSQ